MVMVNALNARLAAQIYLICFSGLSKTQQEKNQLDVAWFLYMGNKQFK